MTVLEQLHRLMRDGYRWHVLFGFGHEAEHDAAEACGVRCETCLRVISDPAIEPNQKGST